MTHRNCRCLLIAIFTTLIACTSTPAKDAGQSASSAATAAYITDVRQVTHDGLRAGEGYFSADGQSLIFQSERESDNPFYQIYLLNLRSGKTTRLSPGQGKTTCAWLHPNNKQALFSSTHADPQIKQKVEMEWKERKSEKKSKYSWSFDDQFDIYQVDLNGKNLKNLTRAPGYDAEASYSPDGKWIAFASNRQAYLKPMTDEQKKLFAKDPSVMMDLFIMRADGTDVRQITNALGYDGGPFFSPDGKRLTFRRFTPDGLQAEVHTINVDGTDDRQLTNIKAMSWAPFYHPSGDYIIFTTNKLGYANFELYIVDTLGQRQPVRVSQRDGFDGLPVFTPDGQEIYWTHSNERGEAQIYRAKWSDSLARAALGLPPRATPPPSGKTMQPTLSEQDARAWVEYLASESMQGRMTGSKEEREYMGRITTAFREMGLLPYGAKEMLHTYSFTSGLEIENNTKLEIKMGLETPALKLRQDWIPLSFSSTGTFAAAPIVFGGYGIVAPSGPGQAAYNSYEGLDVKDKWVMAFTGLPNDIGNERRFHLHLYSRLQHKAMMARQLGARGLILIDDTEAASSTLDLQFEGRDEVSGVPVIRLSSAVADRLLKLEKTSRKEWTSRLAKGEVANLVLKQSSLAAELGLKFTASPALNAVGVLRVPGATSTVVIGAHGDHLGLGEKGNSLWRGEPGRVHLGADDNASGVAGLLGIAKELAEKQKRGELKLRQNIAFAVWSGEELGVLGSSGFLKANPKLKISAYLNMDMIGRLREQFMVQGTASAAEWKTWIESVNLQKGLPLRTQEDPYLPTDAMVFYMRGIPVLSFFTGSHSEYHMPTDTPALINYQGLVQVADFVATLSVKLAAESNPLTYKKVEAVPQKSTGRGFRLYLGTIPDYSQDGKTGVTISGTSKDSPAEKAGLKAGDTIVELGGMKVQNLNDYVYCLQALKANVITSIKVRRNGMVKNLEVTPALRN